MFHIIQTHTNTVHKIASLAVEENSACCQYRSAHNIKHMEISIERLLNTDAKVRDRTQKNIITRTMH